LPHPDKTYIQGIQCGTLKEFFNSQSGKKWWLIPLIVVLLVAWRDPDFHRQLRHWLALYPFL